MIGSLLVVLSLVLTFAQESSTVQHAVGPIVVDGDMAIRSVSTHPGEPVVATAGTNGLYAHEGEGWSKVGPVPPEGRIVWAGWESPLMLAGDHAPCLRGGIGAPLQRSDDGGATWTPVEGAPDFAPLAIWEEPALALASSCAGLQVSRDGGLTWSPLTGIEPGWELTAFAEVPQSDGSGPVVLVGLTGEGGTSYLRSIDLSDPLAPAVSSDLRMYYAVAGVAGNDETFVLAAMDGAWISEDAGATWTRSAGGLEQVVLEQDPAQFGFPEDVDPRNFGLFSAAFVNGERPGIVVGSIDGLYLRWDDSESWTRIEGTSGRVDRIAVSADGSLIVYATEEGVFQIDIVLGA